MLAPRSYVTTLLLDVARTILKRMRCGILLLASAGCASPGDPPDERTALITVNNVGGRVEVTAPSYTMNFASSGILMPEHLIVGGSDVLGSDGCNTEALVGVATYPATRATGGRQGIASRSTIERLIEGPLIAQVHVTYEVDYMCPTLQTLSGESFFTFFPSGRIVREDRGVRPSTTALRLSTNCGCQDSDPPSNLYFTSFWAFDPNGAIEVDASGSATTGGQSRACTMYPNRAIGVAWNGERTRIRPNTASAHVFDWVADADVLEPFPQQAFSAIQISTEADQPTSRCGDILAGLADQPIQIGGMLFGSTGSAGIYEDTVVHRDAFVVAAVGDPIPPGFAISMDLDGASHATFSRHPAVDGDVALLQHEPNSNRLIVVFPHGLQLGDTITIEPRF